MAAQHKLPSTNSRDVIRALKKVKIPKDKLLEFYGKRLADIEDILRREHLVTLPARKAQIRLAMVNRRRSRTPHMDPPR